MIAYERINQYSTATELWENLYCRLSSPYMPKYPCRKNMGGDETTFLIAHHSVLTDTRYPLVLSETRAMSLRYLVAELRWYIKGEDTWESFETNAGKHIWKSWSDDGVHVNSNYGHKVQYAYGFNQLEYCINLLKADQFTRQAVIHIKPPLKPETPSKDTCCTVMLQFAFNDLTDGLDAIVYMRSSDIWKGIVYDLPFFTLLLQVCAANAGLDYGELHFIAGNVHLYTGDVKEFIESPLSTRISCREERFYPVKALDPIDWNQLLPILTTAPTVNDAIDQLCEVNNQFELLKTMSEVKNAK